MLQREIVRLLVVARGARRGHRDLHFDARADDERSKVRVALLIDTRRRVQACESGTYVRGGQTRRCETYLCKNERERQRYTFKRALGRDLGERQPTPQQGERTLPS